jgi:long-chain acyl-CoA synthetase
MDYANCPSLTAAFFERASERGDKPFLWAKRDGRYQPWTWQQVNDAVRDLSRGLRDLGISTGDRVMLVSENRPEWLIADFAIMAAGAITVPAYTTNTERDHRHILNDSQAKLAIVSTTGLAKSLLPAAMAIDDCEHLVAIEPLELAQTSGITLHRWDDLLARGRELPDDVEAVAAKNRREDIACFIYTSGTGGTPKGVMLTHGNILSNCLGAYDLLASFGLGQEVFLSFLPLSHSYEHTAGQAFPVTIGAEIYYAEGVDSLLNNLAEARPTIMTAVPRLYEMMHQKIRRNLAKQKPLAQRLFADAERLGRARYANGGSLSLGQRPLDWLVERLVREKFRQRFGGRLKAMVSGGAALNPDIGLFFHALGIRILQGYGQTEAAPVVSANRPDRIKMHTVGPPLKGVGVKIAEDGEILVRGELVMKGYWRQPEATAEAIRGGWLCTGDIGKIDPDGSIIITDRKKDIVVLSGGDNVAPARIEGFLTLQPELAQAMVSGDKPRNLAELAEDGDLRKELSGVIDRVNQSLSNLEKVRRFTIAPEPFSVENGMMTPTLKIRRHVIRETYGERIEALYRKS